MSDAPTPGQHDATSEAPARRAQKPGRRRIAVVTYVLAAALILGALWLVQWSGVCSYGGLYLCTETGALMHVTGVCIPATNAKLTRSTVVEETSVSRHIRAALGDKTPAHHWVFIHGGSFWVREGGGGGREIANARSTELGPFLHALYDAGEYSEFDCWRRWSLAENSTCRVAAYLEARGLEGDEWQDRAAFRTWWERERDNLRDFAGDCSEVSP